MWMDGDGVALIDEAGNLKVAGHVRINGEVYDD
mgnify:CR=1 FL=1